MTETVNRYPLQAALHASPVLFELALTAPHCAMRTGDQADSIVHAVTMDGFIAAYDGRDTLTGACGADGLKVVSVEMKGEQPLPWPPAVAGLTPFTRCRACWVVTGKRRPRSGRKA